MDPKIIPTFDAEARAVAHSVVDLLFDHVSRVGQRPVLDWQTPEALRELARISGPVSGDPLQSISQLLDYSLQLHHPSYMGHQVCPPFPLGAIGDFVISTLNQSTAVWEMSPFATMIEKEVVGWLSANIGFQSGAAGTMVSGGSAANLTGLLAARARWRGDSRPPGVRPVILCSADAHYSIARAAEIMGMGPDDVVKVETDERHRMDITALDGILEALEDTDRSVMAIVATAGSTATGAFDRLGDIAGLRDRYRTWLHVDAAHGASVVLSPSLRRLVAGIEHADSVAWDPHKMLWMPLSLGAILVRNGEWLRRAFSADAPYLFDAERSSLNLGEMTIQCSKRADAVKLWLMLRCAGEEPFRAALERVTSVTRELCDLVMDSPDFEAMHEPELNIFCFRHVGVEKRGDGELDLLNGRLRQALLESGEAWITSTLLKGTRVLRVTIMNPATGKADLEALLDSLRRIVRKSEE
jgi:L-2,4-diaminobutyrate decarboxylase